MNDVDEQGDAKDVHCIIRQVVHLHSTMIFHIGYIDKISSNMLNIICGASRGKFF